MVWNQLDRIHSPPIVTSDFIYLRLIGDRSINEAEFGSIQKDREQEMKYWSDKFRATGEIEKDVQSITIEIKTKSGAGGTFKDGQLIMQGDQGESVKISLSQKDSNKNQFKLDE